MSTSPTPQPERSEPRPAGGDVDIAVVVGQLSSDPVIRTLESGSILHRYEVTVRHGEGTDTVPVVTFDAVRPPRLTAGDRVAVIGRVRRRFYRAGGATRSATEILATSVTRDGQNRRLASVLEAAAAAVRSGT